MATRSGKKKQTEPKRPRENQSAQRAKNKGDGRAHDVRIVDVGLPDDLKGNPGIGMSKGTTMSGADADFVDEDMREAGSTFEGDVENDVSVGGAADPRRTGRHNK